MAQYHHVLYLVSKQIGRPSTWQQKSFEWRVTGGQMAGQGLIDPTVKLVHVYLFRLQISPTATFKKDGG